MFKTPANAAPISDKAEIDARYRYWRRHILATIWLGYALFYFTRIQNALREGWSGFVETVQSAAVFLVGHWPFIVVGAVCGVIFYKARHPKHKKQK